MRACPPVFDDRARHEPAQSGQSGDVRWLGWTGNSGRGVTPPRVTHSGNPKVPIVRKNCTGWMAFRVVWSMRMSWMPG